MSDRKTIIVRCVYIHERGFFARNHEMLPEDFEALKKRLSEKLTVEDSIGRISYAEEAHKTI